MKDRELEEIVGEFWTRYGAGDEKKDWFRMKLTSYAKHREEKLLREILELKQKESPYVRNHGMHPHPETTLTNAYCNGYNAFIDDILTIATAHNITLDSLSVDNDRSWKSRRAYRP